MGSLLFLKLHAFKLWYSTVLSNEQLSKNNIIASFSINSIFSINNLKTMTSFNMKSQTNAYSAAKFLRNMR